MTTGWKRSLVQALIFTTTFSPVIRADALSDLGREAALFAEEAKSYVPMPTNNNGQIDLGNGAFVDIDELNPATSGSGNVAEHFPDSYSTDVGLAQANSTNETGMNDGGTTNIQSLYEDAYADNPTTMGAAYRVLLDAADRPKIDFRNDPMLDASRDTIDNIDVIAEGFADCSKETNFNKFSDTVHVADYQTCTVVKDEQTSCEVRHDYSAAVIAHDSGPFNMQSCGSGCVELWIGTVGDNYWSGMCSVYEEVTRVKVLNPAAITSATLEYAKWDDYMQVWVGESGSETKVWSGPNELFPPETAGPCELDVSWEASLNTNVTTHFKEADPGGVVAFKIRVSVAGNGEGFGRIRIHYDPSKAITGDDWQSEACVNGAISATNAISDGFATGSVQCTDDPADGSGCMTVDGVPICSADLAPSPIPGIPNTCRRVSVTADYDFFKGAMSCYTDHEGNYVCPTNDGTGDKNTCDELQAQGCGFISQQCVGGADGASGECYVTEATYDCGGSVEFPNADSKTTYQCAGEIRCMGEDCVDINKTSSGDFAQAAALLQMAQTMTQDMACTDGGGGTSNVTCEVFSGEGGTCKQAVGGIQDCCKNPGQTPGMFDYINGLMAINRMDTGIMALKNGNAFKGAYEPLRKPIADGLTEVTREFTSQIETVTGPIDTAVTTVEQAMVEAINSLKETMAETAGELMIETGSTVAGEAAGSAAGQAADEAAAQTGQSVTEALLGETGAAYLSTFMAAYSAVMVAYLAIQLVYACEEEEMELMAKKELRSCTYLGSYCNQEILGACVEKRQSYCCYNSPLSRIVQEQVRPQLGLTFGTPENPICGGIPMDRIQDIDWSKVDLDEWIGILAQNDIFPNVDDINMDYLTGSGSALDTAGDRLDVLERTNERLTDQNIDNIRHDLSDSTIGYKGQPGGP